jgi:hypothetical protein
VATCGWPLMPSVSTMGGSTTGALKTTEQASLKPAMPRHSAVVQFQLDRKAKHRWIAALPCPQTFLAINCAKASSSGDIIMNDSCPTSCPLTYHLLSKRQESSPNAAACTPPKTLLTCSARMKREYSSRKHMPVAVSTGRATWEPAAAAAPA